jgi:hypothetical protein
MKPSQVMLNMADSAAQDEGQACADWLIRALKNGVIHSGHIHTATCLYVRELLEDCLLLWIKANSTREDAGDDRARLKKE